MRPSRAEYSTLNQTRASSRLVSARQRVDYYRAVLLPLRQEVIDQLTLDLKADTEVLKWHNSRRTTSESASPTA